MLDSYQMGHGELVWRTGVFIAMGIATYSACCAWQQLEPNNANDGKRAGLIAIVARTAFAALVMLLALALAQWIGFEVAGTIFDEDDVAKPHSIMIAVSAPTLAVE